MEKAKVERGMTYQQRQERTAVPTWLQNFLALSPPPDANGQRNRHYAASNI